MRKIYEYELDVEEVIEIEMTSSARIIDYKVGTSGNPTLFTLEFRDQPLTIRQYFFFLTGEDLGPDPGTYVATFIYEGVAVHLFEQSDQYIEKDGNLSLLHRTIDY